MRTVAWFSCGAASTVAAILTLREHPDALLVYCDTGGEHPDNLRFMRDVETRLGVSVIRLNNPKYRDHMDVCLKERYLNGPSGAKCTGVLKKQLRFDFQQPDDLQVFGYTVDELKRADRFRQAFPEVQVSFPLIEQGITKGACLDVLLREGFVLPRMYRLGFANNNCIGCVKGGRGYWNRIRELFPAHFERMAKIEREVGHSCIKGCFLDELKPGTGRMPTIEPMSCDFLCSAFEQ